MRLSPHKKWASKYPPVQPAENTPIRVAKRFYSKANRLYARTSNLYIRTTDLTPQAQLNDREVQLQEYVEAERPTRGNGSPIHGNPQQAFIFSATDETPVNTVLDDFTDFVDPLPVNEQDLEFVMIPLVAPRAENAYQSMADRSHRRMVQCLLGAPSGVDTTVMRMERRLSAQRF